ncbi:hypothetical protein BGZ68_003895 [Mortierella alpina]|nr:hypothetical protein BGZ68_003895 [Mortierella alpina]
MGCITVHSIVGIPELAACLSAYLTTSDITHAMATCKAWSEQFKPLLWINLQIGRTLPERTLLEQNVHRIRNADLDLQLIRFDGTFGTNLFNFWATLSRGLPVSSTACSSGPLLCNNSKNLTHLHLEFHDFIPPPIEQAFSALYRLHHLTIRGYMWEESWFLSLLRASLPLPRLSELYCYFAIESGSNVFESNPEGECKGVDDVAEPRGDLKTILEEAIAARTSETGSMDVKIKALRFPDTVEGGDIINIILPMLRSALVEFETFEVPELCYYRPRGFYEEVARKYCPRLRHLTFPMSFTADYPSEVCSFIRGAAELKTVRGAYFSDGWPPKSCSMMRMLITHHSKTLEELEILDCRGTTSSDQQDILASCKKLKRFRVMFPFPDVVDREWGCLGLKELWLTLNRSIHYKRAKWAMKREFSASRAQAWSQEKMKKEEKKRQVKAWAAQRVFVQINQLVVLETLSLGTDDNVYVGLDDRRVSEWDFTLSKGWLAELAGLKNLRHLHMRTEYWSEMSQAEVEFMDAKWPLLGEISFDLKKDELDTLAKQPHWQWLQQKRPELCLSALHL